MKLSSSIPNRLLCAGRRRLGYGALACLLALTAGCSTVRPWINQPLLASTEPFAPPAELVDTDPSMLVTLTLSGGGARAAAFGYGVLTELQKTSFNWKGRRTNLLDQVDTITGVSGGSIMAAYFAAFGAQGLPRFEDEYLRQNFQSSLISYAFKPASTLKLTSPWFGRTHLLAEQLDKLYQGMTFGDLARLPQRARLLVSATDISLGSNFDFTWTQFNLICSDLHSVPLSFAVAASSAVPLLLSPMTLHNYAANCPYVKAPLVQPIMGQKTSPKAPPYADSEGYRSRLLREQARSYQDAGARPYIHLLDGGLSDNLGLRSLLDRVAASGSLSEGLRRTGAAPGSIRKLVLITVNSERDPAQNINLSDQVPSIVHVVDALLFGAGARASNETQGYLADLTQQWQAELDQYRKNLLDEGQMDVFAPDASLHVIFVNLRDAPDAEKRRALMQVPTAFSILPGEVTQLIEAGGQILRNSPEFQVLKRGLAVQP